MATSSKLPFIDGWKIELSKLPSYENFTGAFTEKVDWHILKLIHDSQFLESRPEIKANVKNLIDKTVRGTGELKVTHKQRHECGRFYADDSISLIPMSRHVKHTVFKYLGWLDIDMIKGHPSIAIEMGKLVDLPLPAFENHVNNFDGIVATLSKFYSVEGEKPLGKDNIKWLFNSMIYGGGFDNWVKGVIEGDESYEPIKMRNETKKHPIVVSFKKECVEIMNKIYKENPSLAKKVAEKKDDVYEKKCSVCSYWFQIIENHLVYIVAEHLLNSGILKPKCYGLEYDGLNIPPCPVFDKEIVIKEVNDLIVLTTGLNIKFKFKDYDEDNILNDIIEMRRNIVIEDEPKEESKDENDEVIDFSIFDDTDKVIIDYLNLSLSQAMKTERPQKSATETDLAKIIHHFYKGQFVCCDIGNNTWYEFKNHRWAKTDNGTSLRILLNEEIRSKFVSIFKKLKEIAKTKASNPFGNTVSSFKRSQA